MGVKTYVSVMRITNLPNTEHIHSQSVHEGADASTLAQTALEDGKFLCPLYTAMSFGSVALLGKESLRRAVPLGKMFQV